MTTKTHAKVTDSVLTSAHAPTENRGPAPAIGRHVHYMISEADAVAINQRRTDSDSIAQRLTRMHWHPGAQAHVGTLVHAGDVFPMVIVAVPPPKDGDVVTVNGQVFLDGTDVLWARAVPQVDAGSTDKQGCWFDP